MQNLNMLLKIHIEKDVATKLMIHVSLKAIRLKSAK